MSPPLKIRVRRNQLRALVFDIENKPGTYGGGDFTHAKVTAIGWKFLGDEITIGYCLDRRKRGPMKQAARTFREHWDDADVVMGHNIRGHDIAILNGHFTALDLPVLQPKRTIDTYRDMVRMRGISRSLENLAARWSCPIQKMHLSEYDWEGAYDGVPAAVELMRERVRSDVQINEWLYGELKRRELLK